MSLNELVFAEREDSNVEYNIYIGAKPEKISGKSLMWQVPVEMVHPMMRTESYLEYDSIRQSFTGEIDGLRFLMEEEQEARFYSDLSLLYTTFIKQGSIKLPQ